MVDKEIKHHDNSSGVVSVVLGILSLVFFLIPFIGMILGIVGVVFAYKQNKSMPNKWSRAALWMCWIGIILGAAWTIYYIVIVVQFASTQYDQLQALQGANAGALG